MRNWRTGELIFPESDDDYEGIPDGVGDQAHLNAIQFSGLKESGYKANTNLDNRYDPSRDLRTCGYI